MEQKKGTVWKVARWAFLQRKTPNRMMVFPILCFPLPCPSADISHLAPRYSRKPKPRRMEAEHFIPHSPPLWSCWSLQSLPAAPFSGASSLKRWQREKPDEGKMTRADQSALSFMRHLWFVDCREMVWSKGKRACEYLWRWWSRREGGRRRQPATFQPWNPDKTPLSYKPEWLYFCLLSGLWFPSLNQSN